MRPASGTQKTPSPHRADELGSDLERQARLSAASRPGDGEEACAVREQRDELSQLLLPTDERARRHGEVRGVERPERGEITLAVLIQALGPGQILQPVLAEITDGSVAEQLTSRLREHDLSSVSGRRDSRGPVNVDADVALRSHDRLARVNSHAHSDGAVLEGLPRFRGCGDGVRGAGKGHEERIALRIHLDARVPGKGASQGLPVAREQLGVAGAVFPEEARGAFDVREQESDRAPWQLLGVHGADHRTGRIPRGYSSAVIAKATAKPNVVASPVARPPRSKASGIIVSASMVRIAPAAKASTKAKACGDAPSMKT